MRSITTSLAERLISLRKTCLRSFTGRLEASPAAVTASMSRRRFACKSRGMLNPMSHARRVLTKPQRAANCRRPRLDIQAVFPEERYREAVHAKRHAAGMGDSANFVAQTPGRSEVVQMVVETHAG